jgi:23S rRNA (cytosine1962-C5)-methyltransferase
VAVLVIPPIVFEDDHLLVINKPAGMNTHAPAPYAGEGIHEWLKNREARWANLAIIHRLDKETSGILVFGKTTEANRSLTEQFATRGVRKTYQLVTDRKVSRKEFTVQSNIIREGERYVSKPGGEHARTDFRVINSEGGMTIMEAEPITGRTHQIRVHAAESGFPILGDALYGGTPAARVFLHAERLVISHPITEKELALQAPADLTIDRSRGLREGLITHEDTNAYRLVHGASDGWPGWYVDRLGDYLLSQSEEELRPDQIAHLKSYQAHGAYHKILSRHARDKNPEHLFGETAPEIFAIRENGMQFEISFQQGYSVGLFVDQRENRRRFLKRYVAPDFSLPAEGTVLNTFAYTCGFSICAAKAGLTVTSLDLSKKYLEWGRRNFALNGLGAQPHDFIYGDVFGWLRRLGKKGRSFDAIILDPPTFSHSKEWGAFQAQMDYGKLVTAALPLLTQNGVLLASTNAAGWKPQEFLAVLESAIDHAERSVTQQHYAPQPPDFPITREEPGYLKTFWLRIR